MEFNAADLSHQERYKLLTGAVTPRPIAWVSSVSVDGVYNLAPFSFFTVICPEPPLVVFCPMIRGLNRQPKDTLRNIEATGEFVINIVSEDLVEPMNRSSVEAPPELDEFAFAGLTPLASKLVNVPRVAESPIQFECKLHQIIKIGENVGQGSMVIGEIVYFHIDDRVYLPDHKINLEKLLTVGRLGATAYAYTREIFHMERPPSQIPQE